MVKSAMISIYIPFQIPQPAWQETIISSGDGTRQVKRSERSTEYRDNILVSISAVEDW